MKSPKRRDRNVTYESILDAAQELMAELGPEGLTVSEVVHRAGVNRTTAYQHFRTREQVIDAVMARLSREVSRMLEAEMSLGERIDHMVKFHLEHPDVARLWLFQMLSDVPVPKDGGWERYLRAMNALAASDRTADGIDPDMLAAILLGATLVWSLLARKGPKGEDGAREATARFLRELKRLLLYGVLKPAEWPELAASIAACGDAKETA
ncbi:MAG: TetR/AcrR family transcriptional regulator [Candidatus Binatia bacterium]